MYPWHLKSVPSLGSLAGGEHGCWNSNPFIMHSQHKKTNKRTKPLSESDEESCGAESFPRFMVLQSTDDARSLSALSPFVIEKVILGSIGTPKSVKKTKIGLSSCRMWAKESNRQYHENENILWYTSDLFRPHFTKFVQRRNAMSWLGWSQRHRYHRRDETWRCNCSAKNTY